MVYCIVKLHKGTPMGGVARYLSPCLLYWLWLLLLDVLDWCILPINIKQHKIKYSMVNYLSQFCASSLQLIANVLHSDYATVDMWVLL